MKYVKALFYALAMSGCCVAFRSQATSMWYEPDAVTFVFAAAIFCLGTYFAYEVITALTK